MSIRKITRLKLVLADKTEIVIKSNEKTAYYWYGKLRTYYEERNIKFKFYIYSGFRWKRMYTINDIDNSTVA